MAYYDTSDLKNFAEKIGNGIVDVGREVAGRAKEFGDTAGLSLKLREKESNLEKLYFDLGVEYFKDHREDDEHEYEQIGQIEELQGEIRQLRDEIAFCKGKNVCYQCGEFVEKSARFCPNCGEKLN